MSIPERSVRTARISAEVLERERARLGWTLEELARRSQLHVKTLGRLIDGKPGYMATIARLAGALKVPAASLYEEGNYFASPAATPFEIRVRTFGVIRGAEQLALLMRAAEDLIVSLSAKGIDVLSHDSNLALTKVDRVPERLLICVEGVRRAENRELSVTSFDGLDAPWFYCAIVPDQLPALDKFLSGGGCDPARLPRALGVALMQGFGIAPHAMITAAMLRSAGQQNKV